VERKHLTLSLVDACIKAHADGGYSFEGYASKFNGVDSYGDTILPGAYKGALRELKAAGRAPKMFFNHDTWGLPVGKWRKFDEDDSGLIVAGTLTKGMSRSEDIKLALADETLDGLSVGIGLKSSDVEYVEDPKSATRRIIKSVSSLREISLVSFPADDHGRVDMDSIKAELDDIQSVQDLEFFLRDAGKFSKSAAVAIVGRAKAILRGDPGEEDAAKKEAEAMLASFSLPSLIV
jgi:HK97 family phage prohead protease